MQRLWLAAITLVLPFSALADTPEPKKGIEGYWQGTLHIGAIDLRIGFKIKKNDDGKLKATMDSIDQGAKDIPVQSAEFADDTLTLKMPNMKAAYSGKLQADGNTIKGEFDQVGKLPMDLKRTDGPISLKRPQEPKKPYPYVEEEVTFPSKGKDVKLAGTITRPKGDGPFPTVIMITGSGPQNRDEELLGHKPFLVIADYLARKGIAVLRHDDRGVGKSTGDHGKANSQDFADDTAGAVAFLKGRKEVGKIGLMGHSEGGMIAPIVAAADPSIGFIILLAGPGTPGDEILIAQGQLIVKAMGGDEKALARQKSLQEKLLPMAKAGADEAKLKAALREIEKELTPEEKKEFEKGREAAEAQIARLATPWFRYFLTYDPRPNLEKVKCPLLAINGDKDLQVPCKENLSAIESAVKSGGNKDVTVREFPGLNHLFQPTKKGLPSEYGLIETTFDPEALEVIAEWIGKRK